MADRVCRVSPLLLLFVVVIYLRNQSDEMSEVELVLPRARTKDGKGGTLASHGMDLH